MDKVSNIIFFLISIYSKKLKNDNYLDMFDYVYNDYIFIQYLRIFFFDSWKLLASKLSLQTDAIFRVKFHR